MTVTFSKAPGRRPVSSRKPFSGGLTEFFDVYARRGNAPALQLADEVREKRAGAAQIGRHPLIDGLPDFLHIADYGQASGSWMEGTLKIIGAEVARDKLGSDLIALKLSEIIFAQALRTYIESDAGIAGSLAGFADPAVSKALKAIHDDPGHPWTLEKLASIAGVSRTLLANRFSQLLQVTPLAYITGWRMQLARRRLLAGARPIIDIAESVGYQSEAAFGRVFKRHFNIGPATYRRQRATQ